MNKFKVGERVETLMDRHRFYNKGDKGTVKEVYRQRWDESILVNFDKDDENVAYYVDSCSLRRLEEIKE